MHCASSIANYIANRVWHSTQEIQENKDGSIELFMKTSGWKELVRFVLSWQPDMVVVAPVELEARIKTKMVESLNQNY